MRVTMGERWAAGCRLAAVLGLLLALAIPEPASAAQTTAKRASWAERTSIKATAARPKASAKATRSAASRKKAAPRQVRKAPPRPSWGQLAGLRDTTDPLGLGSSVALVVDQETDEILFSKNPDAVLPIASITKLMTALVVLDGGQPLDEELTITQADVDTYKGSSSRLHVGARLTRGEMLQLALMSSENRAAHALGRHYPGGMERFVEQMNRKAREIGMSSSHFVEPTGLSSYNVSNARDLARLVRAASDYPLIREYSTASGLTVDTGFRTVSFRNTNRLVGDPEWDIGLQKTGYLSDAGNCVVMQTRIDGRAVVLVLLDAQARWARVGDAQRIRTWLERMPGVDTGTGGVSAPGAGARKVSAQRADQLSRDS